MLTTKFRCVYSWLMISFFGVTIGCQKTPASNINEADHSSSSLASKAQPKSLDGVYRLNVPCKSDPNLLVRTVIIESEKTIIEFRDHNRNSQEELNARLYPPGHPNAFVISSIDQTKKFHIVDIEGMAIAPKYRVIGPGEYVDFSVTFERIDNSMNRFHVTEGQQDTKDMFTWNCLNILLKSNS